MSNKRRAMRQQCYVPVEGKAGSGFARVKTLDISAGGMGFLGLRALPLRKRIAVEIQTAPGSEPIVAVGRICWVKKEIGSKFYRFGLKFYKFLSGSLRELK